LILVFLFNSMLCFSFTSMEELTPAETSLSQIPLKKRDLSH